MPDARLYRDDSLPGGEKTAAVLGSLTRAEARLVTDVLDSVERSVASGRKVPKHALKAPTWLISAGLTDAKWRRLQALPTGALLATALARLMDRGTLISTFMTEVGIYPRHARSNDPEWVPDRVTIDGADVAMRGEISFAGLTPDNDLVRFVVHDMPLGRVADGAAGLEALFGGLERHVLDPGTPLGALGLATAPVFMRRGATLGVASGTAHVKTRVGIDEVARLRHALDAAGVRYVAWLEESRSPLLADLAPIEIDRFGVARTVGGPRVILRRDVVSRLTQRLFHDLDQHRFAMDDYALDGESYLSVYPSGFGLPDDNGRYDPVAVCVYQQTRAKAYLIGGWDLRDSIERQELATVVHYASDPNALETLAQCRKHARMIVDIYRPASRGQRADIVAAELEHSFYMFSRLEGMMSARR